MEPINDNIMITNKMSSYVENFVSSDFDESLISNSVLNNINLNNVDINFNNSTNTNNFDFTPNNSINPKIINTDTPSDLKNKIIEDHKSNKKISAFNFENENKSFNRLQIIQKLLKKESALKELFIQTSTETLKTIESECREIYKKKLDVFTILQKFSRKEKELRKYILVDEQTQKANLRDLNNYVPKFLLYLWDEPKLIVKLLQKCSIKDIKNHLAPLITNNFYENILSVNYIEENYLYVICLLLKEEIESLNSTYDVQLFLQDTPCGCLLDQLINKTDIKSYFKTILQNVVENIEINCSEKEMSFNIKKIEKEIQDTNIKNNNKNKKNQKNIFVKDDAIFRKDIYLNRRSTNIDTYSPLYKGVIEKQDRNSDIASLNTNFTNRNMQMNPLIFNGIKLEENDKNKEKELFDIESYDLFSTKYIPDLSTNELYLRLKTCENIKMKDYYQFQINNSIQNKTTNSDLQNKLKTNTKNYYSNEKFLDSIFNTKFSDKVIYCYQYNFMKVINIIDEIFKSLLNNLPILPYSIKCLCRIISILIKKKFHGLSDTEENSFIDKFFFCKLFAPIFRNPSTLALINKYIISGKTLQNLETITLIILQLVSGRLYRNGGKHTDFTPFNWFFLDQMPSVLKFFDYITNKVKLPYFIEQCLNEKLDNNFKYDYFEQNPDEIICHRSICFNIHDISCLLENMKAYQDILFSKDSKVNMSLKKTFEKLIDSKINQMIIKELKNNKIYEKADILNKESDAKTPIIKYYLVTDFLYNNKYKYLFLLEQKTPQYNIKELKDIQNNEENIKNNIIKVKNYLNTLLYNYRSLVKTDFEEGTTSNLINILKELKIFMKSSNFVIDGSIPSEWYINSLIEFLKKIPEEYIKKDYELLLDSIEKEVNDSISKLDFEILSICLNKMKYLRKNILSYDNAKEILIDILLNNKVNKIIEDDGFQVELSFTYEKDKKELFISKFRKAEKQLQLLDSMIFQNNNKKDTRLCKSIDSFTKYFPNLISVQKKSGIKDIFELQNELNLPQKLENFFDYVREYLSKEKKIKDQKLFELINEKIYDYVMSKLYDRIFPKEPYKLDNDIYEKTISLSWIEPRHIIPEKKNYLYDSFLPDVINNFYLLDKNKSPRIKLKNMTNIFMTITNIVKFNNSEKNDIGVDDLMPILNYSVIKAQPIRLFSNCKFMELYIGNLKNKNEGSQLTQLGSICMNIIEINHNTLIDVNVREFENKCFQCLYDKINSFHKD